MQAALEASKEIMAIYKQDFEVMSKDDGSPITLADQNSSNKIISVLKELDLPIICEEEQIPSYSIRKNWPAFWLVDPLDGTKEFVKKNDEFCINIALIENNQPVFGLIASPVNGETIYGSKEIGIWKGNLYSDEPFLEHKAQVNNPETIRIVGSRSHNSTFTNIPTVNLENRELLFLYKGSALKFIDLVLGRAELYYRQGPTMEWDTAAGHALLNACGGKLLNVQGESLVYNKECLLNPDFIAKTLIFAQY